MAKKSPKKIPAKAVKKLPRGSSKYRQVQSLLSKYAKDKNIHLGKGFNRAASRMHAETKDIPIKRISENIDQIYDKFGKSLPPDTPPLGVDKPFPEGFDWFYLEEKLTDSHPVYGLIFDGVTIRVTLTDLEFGFETKTIVGNTHEILEQYNTYMWPHLRTYRSKSPIPKFKILDTDKRTFVDYEIEMPEEPQAEPGAGEVPGPAKEEPVTEAPSSAPPIESEVDKQIALEKEKQKTIAMQRELIQERMKLFRELKDAGFTNDEIKSMLGI